MSANHRYVGLNISLCWNLTFFRLNFTLWHCWAYGLVRSDTNVWMSGKLSVFVATNPGGNVPPSHSSMVRGNTAGNPCSVNNNHSCSIHLTKQHQLWLFDKMLSPTKLSQWFYDLFIFSKVSSFRFSYCRKPKYQQVLFPPQYRAALPEWKIVFSSPKIRVAKYVEMSWNFVFYNVASEYFFLVSLCFRSG